MKNTILFYNGISVAFADVDGVPSLSIMALSGYLKSKGYEVALLPNRVSEEDLRSMLGNCLAVGFSVYTGNGLTRSLKMAERIRRCDRGIPLIWGGYHPTLEAEQVLSSKLADYVVRGEGERTLEELLCHIRNPSGGDIRNIEGLSFVSGADMVHNKPRIASRMSEFPVFDYSLYDRIYRTSGILQYIGSRGCPFDCKFCCTSALNRMHGRRYDCLPLGRVIEDLQTLVAKYSPRTIDFCDDTFFCNKERVREFIKEYRRSNFAFRWTAFGRCDFFASAEGSLLDGLREINVSRIYFGVESGSQRILDMVRKRIRIEDVGATARNIHAHGIAGDFTFMCGFPNETEEDVKASLGLRKQIKRISPESTVRFYVYTPLPGTETMDECERLGYRKPSTANGWDEYEYHVFRTPWVTARYAAMISNIAWATFFDTSTSQGASILLRMGHAVAKLDGRVRLKFNMLRWAPEFQMLTAVYRRRLVSSTAE